LRYSLDNKILLINHIAMTGRSSWILCLQRLGDGESPRIWSNEGVPEQFIYEWIYFIIDQKGWNRGR